MSIYMNIKVYLNKGIFLHCYISRFGLYEEKCNGYSSCTCRCQKRKTFEILSQCTDIEVPVLDIMLYTIASFGSLVPGVMVLIQI